jgi:outer membrane protein assembly factor BamA
MFYGKREDDKRGLQLAIASLEYRIKSSVKLFFPTYLSIRYDMGSTWSSFETIKIAELQHGLGIGIIADTPIGNARITAGKSFYFVKNPDGIVQGPLLFSFAIGTNF